MPLCYFLPVSHYKGNAVFHKVKKGRSLHASQLWPTRPELIPVPTLQGFGVHFCYNYLMDFYQNEAIVKQQSNKISKHLKEGQQIVRDRYHRFCVVDVVNYASFK